MSDDIERLLREASAAAGTGSAGPSPAPATGKVKKKGRGKDVAATGASSEVDTPGGAGGRLAFAVVMAVVLGGLAWVAGVFLPFTAAIPMGMGGALGAFLCALVAGPPRWFSS